jgi:hypothetical protein
MSYLAISKSLAGFLTEKAGLAPEKEVVLTYPGFFLSMFFQRLRAVSLNISQKCPNP